MKCFTEDTALPTHMSGSGTLKSIRDPERPSDNRKRKEVHLIRQDNPDVLSISVIYPYSPTWRGNKFSDETYPLPYPISIACFKNSRQKLIQF